MASSQRSGAHWLQISQIALATRIPEKFLEQILLNLKNEGFLKSRRGIGGGYSLNLPEKDITLDKILDALEGSQFHFSPDTLEDGEVAAVLTAAIRKAEEAARNQLRSQNLATLVDEVQENTVHRNQVVNYEI